MAGCCMIADPIVGAAPPDRVSKRYSPAARALISQAFDDLDPEKLVDVHVHIAGLGAGGTGCTINPEMQSLLHPIKRLQFEVYLRAAGVKRFERADQDFVDRLAERAGGMPGRFRLLAFDKRYRRDGTVDEKRTEFHVPNDYVLKLAEEHPGEFLPTISVHPYRKDALQELDRGADRGATMVKWLPNSQGIDPSDPACDAFYDRMRERGLSLLSHAGEEKAVDACEDQRLGNPLRLRRALDRGVKVIVAHCGSLGENEDLDDPGRRARPNFELFLRMMAEERYRGLLFGELSAITQYNRFGDVLATLLRRRDLHDRLVNGSDYPLPAIGALIRTRSLVRAGFLTAEERLGLNEIFDSNPLLFDFVLKRTLHAPGTGEKFAPSIFMENGALRNPQ
jgi:predicted TIM-barrel fold metal-dependent hydrolase